MFTKLSKKGHVTRKTGSHLICQLKLSKISAEYVKDSGIQARDRSSTGKCRT